MSHPFHVPTEIFVVDDDLDLCEIVTWALRKEGYSVRDFTSGKAALSSLKDSRPALLIVDYHLGDMDGSEFLSLRSKISQDVPVILISGSPNEVLASAPKGEYAEIVEKPLDLEKLLQEIRSLNVPCSQRASSEASRPLSRGPASAE